MTGISHSPSMARRLGLGLLAGALLTSSAMAGIHASSTLSLSYKPASTYGVQNLIDNDLKTVWIEGKEGPGEGESFTLDLPRAEIKKVVIFPGHGEDERMFKKYAHLKEVSLTFFSITDKREPKIVKQQNFTFEDAFKYQEIPVEGVKLGEELFGGHVEVKIRSVYPGGDFQDTAIAEARVILGEYPAQTDVTESPAAQKGLTKDNLNDASPKTVWISEQPVPTTDPAATFMVSAPDYGLTAVVITAGDNRDPKKKNFYARPKDITVELSSVVHHFTLKDSGDAQRFEFAMPQGYAGSLQGPVKIIVNSVYPGTGAQNLSITEIQLIATNYSS